MIFISKPPNEGMQQFTGVLGALTGKFFISSLPASASLLNSQPSRDSPALQGPLVGSSLGAKESALG